MNKLVLTLAGAVSLALVAGAAQDAAPKWFEAGFDGTDAHWSLGSGASIASDTLTLSDAASTAYTPGSQVFFGNQVTQVVIKASATYTAYTTLPAIPADAKAALIAYTNVTSGACTWYVLRKNGSDLEWFDTEEDAILDYEVTVEIVMTGTATQTFALYKVEGEALGAEVEVAFQPMVAGVAFAGTGSVTAASGDWVVNAPQDWPDDPSTVAGQKASVAFDSIPAELANVDAAALATWAKGNGQVPFADKANIFTEAYLLNCENLQPAIDAAKAAFRFTAISVDGTVELIVYEPADGYNGTIIYKGCTDLATPAWHDKAAGDRFFKAELVIDELE